MNNNIKIRTKIKKFKEKIKKKEITDIKNFPEFLDYLLKMDKNGITIFIVAHTNIGRLSQKYADSLMKLGVLNDLSFNKLNKKTRRGFISIIKDGKSFKELLANPNEEIEYIDDDFEIFSSIWRRGEDKSHLKLKSSSYSNLNLLECRRGLNFVIINNSTNKIIESSSWDTFKKSIPSHRSDIRSKIDDYLTEEERIKNLTSEYEEFKSNFNAHELPELKLRKPNFPFGEIALVLKDDGYDLKNFSKEQGFNLNILSKVGNKKTSVISTDEFKKDSQGVGYIFSGICYHDSNLIYGSEELDNSNVNDIHEIQESIGEFEFLIFDESTIKLGNDYFGFGKWFYFQDNENFIAATSYHLLLLLLKELRINFILDSKNTLTTLGVFSWATNQLFTEELNVSNTFLMDPDKKIEIDFFGEVDFKKTEYYKERNFPQKYDDLEYEKLLLKSKEELIDLMAAVFKHPLFEEIIIDITDGLDSRTTIAIALNLPKHLQKKLKLYTIPKEGVDFKTANAIANMLNIPFSPINQNMEIIPQSEGIDESQISTNLGTYYMISNHPSINKGSYHNALRLTGGNGGNNFAFPGMLNILMYDKYLSLEIYVLRLLGDRDLFKNDIKAKNYFKELLKSEFQETNSDNGSIITDNYYGKLRNRIHFSSKRNAQTPNFVPLQSKSAYKAKKMSFEKEVSFAFHYDLLRILNPLISDIPHIDSNQRRRRDFVKKNKLNYQDEVNVNFNLDFNSDRFAESQKNRKTYFLPNKEEYNKQKEEFKEKQNLYDWVYNSDESLLSCLKEIIEKMPELETVGFQYYKFIKERHYKKPLFVSYPNIMKNKLLSIYYQLKLVE